MSWSLRLVTPPASEPLGVEEVKQLLRIDVPDEDDMVTAMAVAARQTVEEHLSRSLLTQTWELGLPCFPREYKIILPRGPVQSVTSISYTDSAGTSHTMTAGTDYLTDLYNDWAEVVLPFGKVWPPIVLTTARPVVIRFVAGYGDTADTIPVPILLAIKQMVGGWYENREDYTVARTSQAVVELPNAGRNLLANYRLHYPGPFRT
jgi:uncharacterized phiE125 gp8 family phage protein